MSSDRKMAANRRNGRKGCGPRSAAGKATASRNSLRHGLAACRQPASSEEIERFAMALCQNNEDAALLAQARTVAANEMVLRAIEAQKMAVVERLRDRTAIALAKGDNSFIVAKACFLKARVASKEIQERVPGLLAKYQGQLLPPSQDVDSAPPAFGYYDDMVPIRLKALVEETDSIEVIQRALALARQHIEAQERDDYEALEQAAPDLLRLERYERRAWSKQKKAIYALVLLCGDNGPRALERESQADRVE
jgi:hypothetical protein